MNAPARIQEERGSALLVAIVLTIILTATVSGMFALLNAATTASTRSARLQSSILLAEAGIDKAAAALRADAAYRGEQHTPLGDGEFSVEVTLAPDNQQFIVVSSATLFSEKVYPTRIEAIMSVTPTGVRIISWKEFLR